MVALFTVLFLFNMRLIVRGYYYKSHWAKALIPGFIAGVMLMSLMHVLTTAYYWDTSIWWPDWRDPAFLILARK